LELINESHTVVTLTWFSCMELGTGNPTPHVTQSARSRY